MPKLNIYKRGDKVLVKKGTVIYECGGKQRLAGRDYVVTVYRDSAGWSVSAHLALNDRDYYGRLVQRGYNMDALKKLQHEDSQAFHDLQVVLEPPRVIWSGKSGWCEADLDAVELVSKANII
jgi:hypothetical protein